MKKTLKEFDKIIYDILETSYYANDTEKKNKLHELSNLLHPEFTKGKDATTRIP